MPGHLPYSRGGLVYSGVLDHTSQLRLLETRFGTPVPNLTPWRRSAVGDLTGAFDFAAAPDPSPTRVTPILDPYLAVDAPNAGPATLGKGAPYPYPPNSTPAQEPGTRRRPSGIVLAAAAPAAPAGAHVEPATATPADSAAAPARGSSLGPSAARESLATTGRPLYDEAVKGAGLVALGAVIAGAASRLPGPAPTAEEPSTD